MSYRVVVEVPEGTQGVIRPKRVKTGRSAVHWLQDVLANAGYPSMRNRVKEYDRVIAGEKLKLVEDDAVTRLRALRDELTEIIRELETRRL